MKSLILAFSACILFSGCVATMAEKPSQKEDKYAVFTAQKPDYGYLPTFPEGLREMAKNHFQYRLKDPTSAIIKVTEPEQCYMRAAPISGGKITQYGWCTRILINAKNSFGAYTGFQIHRIFIKDGAMTEFQANPWFAERWFAAQWLD